jgi:hypothetical protein
LTKLRQRFAIRNIIFIPCLVLCGDGNQMFDFPFRCCIYYISTYMSLWEVFSLHVVEHSSLHIVLSTQGIYIHGWTTDGLVVCCYSGGSVTCI